MIRFRIDIYNHGIHIKVCFQQDRSIMVSFNNTLRVFELRKVRGRRGMSRVLKHVFFTYNPKTTTYGLHRNMLDDFKRHLNTNRVSDNEIELITHGDYIVHRNRLEISSEVELRKKQIPVVKFAMENGNAKILPLPTGYGKTLMGLYVAAQLGVRTAVVCGAMHIPTWLKDSEWIYTKHSDNILVVKGSKGMRKVIGDAKSGKLHAGVLLFSVNVIRDYLSEFDKTGESTYGCNPIDFYSTIGVGLRIVDESHENLHFQFRHDIGTNVAKIIYLSATIHSNDAFTNQMYEVIFPLTKRYSNFDNNKHADVIALGYGLEHPSEVQCLGPTKQYNHTVYEGWLRKNFTRKSRYLEMITYVVGKGFVDAYVPGAKMLVFVSGVDMCKDVSNHLAKHFPERTHSAFTSEHDETVLHNHDIIVTTPGSASTGKDIKKLMVVLLTVSIGSRERSSQTLGRLRDLKDQLPGNITPVFYYLVCRDIPNHIKGHNMKLALYPGISKSVTVKNLSYRI